MSGASRRCRTASRGWPRPASTSWWSPAPGRHAYVADDAFTAAGATVAADGADWAAADVVLHVSPLTPEQVARLRRGCVTAGLPRAGARTPTASGRWRRPGRPSFALELLPRISRAQSMDALTSQALVSGYRAALVAAERLPPFFPLLMTAAGTVPPAKVLVLGAGVAGLQAIATAKRLGAVVEAYDVRAASADEVRSMGAKFVELDLEALEGTGGYAREMTEDRAAAPARAARAVRRRSRRADHHRRRARPRRRRCWSPARWSRR